jgi:hypothetical protein
MPTQLFEILCAHTELNRRNDGGRWNCTEAIVGHTQYVDHHSNPAAWPDIGRGSTAGDIDERLFDRSGQ